MSENKMPKHRRPAAVMIPLLDTENGTDLIFEIRAKGISQANDICFPGGSLEADEVPEDAAVRETCEELLISEDSIGTTYDLFQLIGPGGRTVHVFAGEIEASIESFNEDEISEIFTMPLDHFINNPPKKLEVVYEMCEEDKARVLELIGKESYDFNPGRKNLYFYDTPHGVIWGLTAEIIYRYVNM